MFSDLTFLYHYIQTEETEQVHNSPVIEKRYGFLAENFLLMEVNKGILTNKKSYWGTQEIFALQTESGARSPQMSVGQCENGEGIYRQRKKVRHG